MKPVPDLRTYTCKPVVTISFPLATLHDDGYGKRITSIDAITVKLGTDATSVRISLENTAQWGLRVQDHWSETNPPHGSSVRIAVNVDGVEYTIFSGQVTGIDSWTNEEVVLDCASIAAKYRRDVGTKLNKADYPNIPDASIGKIMPWVWGTIERFKPVLVDDDLVTELTQAALSTDTTLHVQDTTDFASTGSVQINEEVISYTGTTATTFTGCTRGASGTTAGSHVAGNQVIEYGPLEFIVCKHSLPGGSVTNVGYLGRDDVFISADPADYTLDYAGPVKITFAHAPTFNEPSASNKLKIVDMDTDDGSDCTDPTYAAGAHADWTETNYATITYDGTQRQLRLKRTADVVAPTGKPVRVYLVAEYWDNGTDVAKVHYDGHDLGFLPDKSNTPSEILEDETVISMAKGFEDAHTHDMPDGEHQHLIDGSGTSAFLPSIDDGTTTTPNWGTHTNCYDGDLDTYEMLDLRSPGTKSNIKFKHMYTPEGLNYGKRVTKCRVLFHLGRASTLFPQGQFNLRYVIPNTTGAYPDLTITLASEYPFASLPITTPPLPPIYTTFDSGWVDVVAACTYLFSVDVANGYFILENDTPQPNGDFCVVDMEANFLIAADSIPSWTYEPFGACVSAGKEATFDLDWNSFVTNMVPGPTTSKWTFTSISNPDGRVLGLVIAACGEEPVPASTLWQFAVKDTGGTYRYFSCVGIDFGNSQTAQFFDLSAYQIYGVDILSTGQLVRQTGGGNPNVDVIEVGVWLWYEDAVSGFTSPTDVGDTDQQEGNKSSLAWYDITAYVADIDDWQEYVGKQIKVQVEATTGAEAKILRFFIAVEFTPNEQRIAREVVCDVAGRASGFDDMLTDALTQTDLLGVPATSISVPALTQAGAGTLEESVDGWELVQRLLTEGHCHGWWDGDGVFRVKHRPAKGSLGAVDVSITEVDSIKRNIQDIDKLVNKIEALYAYDWITGAYEESLEVENAASQARYGKTAAETVQLSFLRSLADATAFAEIMLSYVDECLTEYMLSAGLLGLALEPGDLVAIATEGIVAAKCEVKEVRIQGITKDVLSVQVKGTKYG